MNGAQVVRYRVGGLKSLTATTRIRMMQIGGCLMAKGWKLAILSLFPIMVSCGIDREIGAKIDSMANPTERGLFFVAAAIVLAAVIRGFLE